MSNRRIGPEHFSATNTPAIADKHVDETGRKLVVCFVPASVDTEWWHRYAAKASEIRFPIGRVKFTGADTGAPLPVAIISFRPRL